MVLVVEIQGRFIIDATRIRQAFLPQSGLLLKLSSKIREPQSSHGLTNTRYNRFNCSHSHQFIRLVGILTLSLMKFPIRSCVLLCVPFISLSKFVSVKKQPQSGTGNVTQLIQCLPTVLRALSSVPSTTETRSGAEAGRS